MWHTQVLPRFRAHRDILPESQSHKGVCLHACDIAYRWQPKSGQLTPTIAIVALEDHPILDPVPLTLAYHGYDTATIGAGDAVNHFLHGVARFMQRSQA